MIEEELIEYRDRRQNMIILLLAAIMLLLSSIFFPIHFDTDTGIEFRRELVVSWDRITLVQHSLRDNYSIVKQHCPIWPLRGIALLAAVVCAVAAFSRQPYRVASLTRVAFALGVAYYMVLGGYVIYLSGAYIATVRLRWGIALPAIAILLVQYIIHNWVLISDDDEEWTEPVEEDE